MFLDENPSTEVLKNTLIEKKDLGYLIFEFKGDSTNLKEIKEFWKENGIWLYSVKPNTVTEISKGIFQDIVWRPDGNNSLIAIQCEDFDVCNKIMEYG